MDPKKHQESKERMWKSGKFMMEVGHKTKGRDRTLHVVDSFFVLFFLLGCTQKRQLDQK